MGWELNDKRPIYSQIIENIKLRIISGFYPTGSRLPSVRELAQEAGVNPNTMQRALTELEGSGLIITMKTSGRIITEDENLILKTKQSFAEEEVEQFFEKMRRMGFMPRETLKIAQNVYENKGKMGN